MGNTLTEQEKDIIVSSNMATSIGTELHTEDVTIVAKFIARIGELFYSKVNMKNLWSKQKVLKAYNDSFIQACREFKE